MSRRNRPDRRPDHAPEDPSQSKAAGGEPLSVGDWADHAHPVRRAFPGPADAQARLRVAIDRHAYADLVAHAKQSLEAEVCGVLAGEIAEDDRGLFLHVQAAIPGGASRQGSRHVTFTQETWNGIHEALERNHPKLRIVGWYHSHPGFGVEFSDMDLFIQRNFFSLPTQIALLIDPLGGDVAICVNEGEGTAGLDRFWVEGREHPCRLPRPAAGGAPAESASKAAEGEDRIATLEKRIGQLIEAVDEQRNDVHRFALTAVFVFCVVAVAAGGYVAYRAYSAPLEMPRVRTVIPVPLEIEGKPVQLGVALTEWRIPPELMAVHLALERERRAAEEARKAEEARLAAEAAKTGATVPATDGAAPDSSTPPSSPSPLQPAEVPANRGTTHGRP